MNINIGDILSGIGSTAKDIRTAITGEIPAEKRAEIELKLKELEEKAISGQTEINKAEAGHKSIFVAGWRPFIGWCCGLAVAYHFILRPIITLILKPFGIDMPFVDLDIGQLLSLLGGMLGLGILRSYDKAKGTDTKTT